LSLKILCVILYVLYLLIFIYLCCNYYYNIVFSGWKWANSYQDRRSRSRARRSASPGSLRVSVVVRSACSRNKFISVNRMWNFETLQVDTGAYLRGGHCTPPESVFKESIICKIHILNSIHINYI
jgi:hypothetical protein